MKSNPSIFEINTRVWIKRFGVKSLANIPDSYWEILKSKGIDFVWLMGIWKTCDSLIEKYCFEEGLVKNYDRALKDWKKEDIIGSPFAIDMYEINPTLGGKKAVLALKKKLNKMGMGLILDFIPNHLGACSSLIKTNPELFLQVSRDFYEKDPHTYFEGPYGINYFAHGRDPFFPAWQDTIQINFFSENTRNFLTDVLLGMPDICDGVRCDMAMLSLNNVFKNTWIGAVTANGFNPPAKEFWSEAIAKVKAKRGDFLFIAEAYWDLEWQLQQLGFDYTYDKKLTDRLRFGNAASVRDHLRAEESYQKKSVRFIENHDETRARAALGKEREKAAAVIISTIQGMRFYHDGQFEGKKIKLPVQLGREPVEPVCEEIKNYYDKLFSITSGEIFKNGNWFMVEPEQSWEGNNTYHNLLAWLVVLNNDKRLVVVNYSDINSSCRIKLDVVGYPDEFVLKDLLDNQSYTRSAEEVFHTGLYVELRPWQSHIFEY